MRNRTALFAGVALMAFCAPALAQDARGIDNKGCAPGRATVGSSGADLDAPNAKKGESLSEHLAKSGGVICPPDNVDPAIKADTPAGGKLQVIPPPGTPQNQPNVQPK